MGFTTLADKYRGTGITAAQVAAGSWTGLQFDVSTTSDFGGLMRTIDASADRGAFYAAYDRDGNGVITQAELGAGLVFNTANPEGGVYYDRDFQAATGPQETFSKGISFFIQDEITFNRLTFNLGLRAERWEHFATTGENIYTFPWEFAPRLSAAYDVLGNGRHKASAYWGRYYDPIRNNMTNFAGTLTGSILEEQVFVTALNKFVTYRTRGGPAVQDAFFSPTTQTPYTDDLQFGYAVDLGNNMSFDARLLQPPDPRHPRGLRPGALRRIRTATPARPTTRTRCSSATTTSATPRTRARTSSSARWPAASATTTAWSSCSASASPIAGSC